MNLINTFKSFKKVSIAFCLFFSVVLGLCAVSYAQQNDDEHHKSLEIKVLTYNVCGLADFITPERNLITPLKKRLKLIAGLIKGYDLIGLQEMFALDKYVVELKLRNHFVIHGTDSQKNPTGSGEYIFSKGVIQKSVYERWYKQYGVDAFSHKGFVGAETILPNGLAIHVYTLHAEAAGGSVARFADFEQLVDAVNRFSKGTGKPILIMGDFNCEIEEADCQWLLAHSTLKHATPFLKPEVDNIFYDENGSGWKISTVSAKYMFDELVNGRRISDHWGLEAVLRFER